MAAMFAVSTVSICNGQTQNIPPIYGKVAHFCLSIFPGKPMRGRHDALT